MPADDLGVVAHAGRARQPPHEVDVLADVQRLVETTCAHEGLARTSRTVLGTYDTDAPGRTTPRAAPRSSAQSACSSTPSAPGAGPETTRGATATTLLVVEVAGEPRRASPAGSAHVGVHEGDQRGA